MIYERTFTYMYMDAEQGMPIEAAMVYTDLALEAHEMAVQGSAADAEIVGLRTTKDTLDGITTSWLWLESHEAAQQIGKEVGTYLTIEVPALRGRNADLEQRVTDHFTEQFIKFLREVGIDDNAKGLIVGLGNWNVTPDSLGPMVVGKSLVTRHFFHLAPQHVAQGYREVSAISPGVMGLTGVETSEVVFGLVEHVKPDFVIAVDALASRSLARLNTTIQIADTGINPGSGVGNRRKALNQKTLGVPVIAIGVPTVVDAVTITNDALDYLLAYLSREMEGSTAGDRPTLEQLEQHQVPESRRTQMMGIFGELTTAEKRDLISEVLAPLGQNLIVTPKDVDAFMVGIANIVAGGISRALHEAVTADNVFAHLN